MRLERSLQQQTRFLIPVCGNSDCLIFLVEAASSAKSPKCAVEVSGKSPQEIKENSTLRWRLRGDCSQSCCCSFVVGGVDTGFWVPRFLFFSLLAEYWSLGREPYRLWDHINSN